MALHKILSPMGGRNDVFFIVHEPNDIHKGFQHAGMYVIRPRNPEQKQYGPHKSTTDTFMSGSSGQGPLDPVGKFLELEKE